MGTGAITQYIDVAQLALYGFWIFFIGLVIYLQREGQREGYPLEAEVKGKTRNELFPSPEPKTFLLHDGRTVTVPRPVSERALNAAPVDGWPGAPIEPVGNPMLAGVGPGSYSDREDVVEHTFEGIPAIVPLRVEKTFSLALDDPEPRGMPVVGGDGAIAGHVHDVWVDRAEVVVRYLEVALTKELGGRHVLLPMNFARVHANRGLKALNVFFQYWKPGDNVCPNGQVVVQSIFAKQFADVPGTKHPDQITKLEEEKVMAYYAGGILYASPARQEPWL
jgi:photosynthetic reaction center H subunit